jgi:hypothetical protein
MKNYREKKRYVPENPKLHEFLEEETKPFCPYIESLADDCIAISRGLDFPHKPRIVKKSSEIKSRDDLKSPKTVNKVTFGDKTKKKPTKSELMQAAAISKALASNLASQLEANIKHTLN